MPFNSSQQVSRQSILANTLRVIVIFILLFTAAACGDTAADDYTSDQDNSSEVSDNQDESEYDTSNSSSDGEDEEYDDANDGQNTSSNNSSSGEREWTVLLYQDADDETLEEDIVIDLNEAEMVGSTDEVTILSQIDRYDGAYDGDGDWTSTKRFLVTQDDDLTSLNSEELDDLGEVNMGDGQTLVDFVTWAVENYPAQKYALILSDHGMGWLGGWTDPDPDPDEDNQIYLNELTDALAQIQNQTGLEKFELIGFDACLMGQLEVFTAIQPYANYSVASEETEPAIGWAYEAFLQTLVEDPGEDGAALAKAIVNTYVSSDQRILDDSAREELTGDNSTEEEAIASFGEDATLTAMDLSQLTDVLTELDNFTQILTEQDQSAVAEARAYAQSYESVFGDDDPASFIDLGNFASLVAELTESDEVAQSASQLSDSLENALLAEKHGDSRPGSTGVTIYFPVSELYEANDDYSGANFYTETANTFAEETAWDDFLAFHYTGEEYEPTEGEVAVPPANATITAPGASEISIDPVEVSDDYASEDYPVTVSTTVHGDNIGFIYIFIGYYDEEGNSILIADKDYFFAEDTKELNGVYYPDWGDTNSVDVEFEFDTGYFNITDGETSDFALFEPEDYGAPDEEATYRVDGEYTFVDSGNTISAVLFFSDAELTGVYGYSGENGTGGMREIIPQDGDTFTVLEQWIDLGEDEDSPVEYATQEGATVTFGLDNLSWEWVLAPYGEYIVGFIVEDLDGNEYDEYTTVYVEDD